MSLTRLGYRRSRRREPGGWVGLAAFLTLLGAAVCKAQVQPCPAVRNCVELQVDGPVDAVERGGATDVILRLRAAESDGQPGGLDEIAALSFSVSIPDLDLADCRLDTNGLTPAFTVAPEVAERFLVRVQNLTCERSDHCLCPTGNGQTRDRYVNLVLTGPVDLFPEELRPEDLPLFATGELLRFRVRVPESAPAVVPLQVFNRSDDASAPAKPQSAAFVSLGDNRATDLSFDASAMVSNVRTIAGQINVTDAATPTEGATPESTPSSTTTAMPSGTVTMEPSPTETPTTSQEATATATLAVACVGDCGADGTVTIDELVMGIGIALDQIPADQCPLADRDRDGVVMVDELISAVNAALLGCR